MRLSRSQAAKINDLVRRDADSKSFSDNIKWIAVMARQMARERPVSLASCFKTPRISIIAGELVSHSDCDITPESLEGALSSFDACQGLNMDEIWLFPRAVSIELIKAFAQTASRVIDDRREVREAVRWVEGGRDMSKLKGHSDAFYEKALKILAEKGSAGELESLEAWLDDRRGAGKAVQSAQRRRSRDAIILSNAVSSLRRISQTDWKDRYNKLCRAEKNLMRDDIYANGDDNSKAAVRRQVARLSRMTGLGEWTVARNAVEMAGEAILSDVEKRERDGEAEHPEAPAVAPSHTCTYWLCDPDGQDALIRRLNGRTVPTLENPG
ncbi:MAG: hypothetical protein Q4D04_14615, partial [Clostridia bacterium]|nr:hypothetical protein [Clostridia bacterium]